MLEKPDNATSHVESAANVKGVTDEAACGPSDKQRLALQAIQLDDQGQGGDLDVFAARECEELGWAEKVDGAYRLTQSGTAALRKRVLDSPRDPV